MELIVFKMMKNCLLYAFFLLLSLGIISKPHAETDSTASAITPPPKISVYGGYTYFPSMNYGAIGATYAFNHNINNSGFVADINGFIGSYNYNNTQWMQFIEYRPAIVLIHTNGKHSIIRRAEDLEVMNRQDVIPEHLHEPFKHSTNEKDCHLQSV